MNCPCSAEIDLGELSEELIARLRGGRHPFSGTFEVTERCNLSCVHCYINRPVRSRRSQAREMTFDQVDRVLGQIADAGCLYLLLTGGEVFARSDLPKILRSASKRGLLITLFTNGTLLTSKSADALAEWPPRGIEITLHGATAGTYERVTQVPGSFARCMQGIELAMERGLALSVKAVLMDVNVSEFSEMQSLARRLGLEFRYDAVLWPRFDGGGAPEAHRLSAQQIVALDREDVDRSQAWRDLFRQFGAIASRGDYVYGCGAGLYSFHVDCAGRLSMCMMARRPDYDLLRGTFDEGWGTFLGALRDKRREMDSACRTCAIGVLCTQCPGWSQLTHGDDETRVDFVCELGRLRAAQFGDSAGSEGHNLEPEPVPADMHRS